MTASVRSTPRVGVVVVHFGDPTPTRACLEALRREGSAVDRRVVVVDNAGNLEKHAGAGEIVLPCPDNPGFGGGANRGVAALGDGPWDALVILNNDVEVGDGFLGAAVDALEGPRVGAAAGPLYLDRPGGRLWYAGGGVNFFTGTVWQTTSRRAAAVGRTVGFFPGAAFALSEQAWRKVDGFDPGFFLYNEDLDLCLRLRRHGFRLRFAPGLMAVHRLGAVTGSGERSPLYLEHMAATRLRPFRPLAYRLYLAAMHSGYVGLRALWYRLAVGGAAGSDAARALLRGHGRALGGIRRGPSEDGPTARRATSDIARRPGETPSEDPVKTL